MISTLRFLPLLAIVCLFSACELFETRDAEPPETGSATFTPPTTPDLVLENLQHAVREKNTGNYLRCLVDTLNSTQQYRFIPSAAALGRYATTFADWSLQAERSYFSTLTAYTGSAGLASLQLSGSFVLLSGDSAVYEGGYDLTFRHGVNGVAEQVRGSVQFVLHTDRSSTWSITRWTDFPVTDQTSWSEWKGRFAR